MIGRTNAGGGLTEKAAVKILGGAYEVITYTGAKNGTVTLNGVGEGLLKLPAGTYFFSAGLSGLTITKACEAGTVVRLRPEHIIYWYGAETGTLTLDPSTRGTVTRNTNSIRLACTQTGAYHTLVSDIDASVGSKCTLKVTEANVGGNYGYLMNEAGISPPNSGQWTRFTGAGTVELSYTYASTRKLKISLYANAAGYYCEASEWYIGERTAG